MLVVSMFVLAFTMVQFLQTMWGPSQQHIALQHNQWSKNPQGIFTAMCFPSKIDVTGALTPVFLYFSTAWLKSTV